MGAIIVIILGLIIIYRIYCLAKLCISYEFFAGSAVLCLLTSLWGDNTYLFLAALFSGGLAMAMKKKFTKNINISLSWLFIMWAPMLVALLIAYVAHSSYFHDYPSAEMVFLYLIICYAIFIYFKPFRVPLYVMINVVLIGFTIYHVTGGGGSNGDGVDSSNFGDMADSGNSILPDNSVAYAAGTIDMNNITPVVDPGAIDTSTMDTGNTILPGDNFVSDNSTMITDTFNSPGVNNDLLAGTTVYDGSQFAMAQFNDGTIYDGQQNIIGSYGFDQSSNAYNFYDDSHNLISSINDKGEFMDGTGQIVGNVTNLGGVTTVIDNDGRILHQLNLEGAPLVDSHGNIIGSTGK